MKAAINTNILEKKKLSKNLGNYLIIITKNFKTYFICTKIVENKYFATIKSNIFLSDSLN